MNPLTTVRLLAAYAWASPNTVLGFVAGLVALGLGGRVRVVRGVVEFSGGLLAAWVAGIVQLVRPRYALALRAATHRLVVAKFITPLSRIGRLNFCWAGRSASASHVTRSKLSWTVRPSADGTKRPEIC